MYHISNYVLSISIDFSHSPPSLRGGEIEKTPSEHPSFPLLPLFPSLQTLILMPGE